MIRKLQQTERGALMKQLFLAGAAVAALAAVPAMAADMPLKAPPPPPPVFSWTSCYLGGHVGIGIDVNRNDFVNAVASGAGEAGEGFGPFNNQSQGGGVAGAQLGCNYQIDQTWVVGIEGEGLWTDITSGVTEPEDAADPAGTFSRFESRNRWDADVAFRLGYAADRSLIYGKAGVAWGGFDFTEWHDDFPTTHGCPGGGTCSVTFTETRPGLLLGGGWEYAVSNYLTFKVEYNFIAFRKGDIPYPDAAAAIQSFSVSDTVHIVKFGLNWRFSSWPLGVSPVTARY
jgi:opacity protein-like surface antigen